MTILNKIRKKLKKKKLNEEKLKRQEYINSLPKHTHLWHDKFFMDIMNPSKINTKGMINIGSRRKSS